MSVDLKQQSEHFQRILQNEIDTTREQLDEIEARINELSLLLQDKEMQTDRSENASFQIARDERDMKTSIRHLLEEKLTVLMSESESYVPTGIIQRGSTVQIRLVSVEGKPPLLDKVVFVVRLVSHAIANAELGLLADDYKCGEKLIGHKVGESIEVMAPKGNLRYEIEGVY